METKKLTTRNYKRFKHHTDLLSNAMIHSFIEAFKDSNYEIHSFHNHINIYLVENDVILKKITGNLYQHFDMVAIIHNTEKASNCNEHYSITYELILPYMYKAKEYFDKHYSHLTDADELGLL